AACGWVVSTPGAGTVAAGSCSADVAVSAGGGMPCAACRAAARRSERLMSALPYCVSTTATTALGVGGFLSDRHVHEIAKCDADRMLRIALRERYALVDRNRHVAAGRDVRRDR